MHLFTMIFEYDGGTYISQVQAPSHETAPAIWAGEFDISAVSGMALAHKAALIRQTESGLETPQLLEGLSSVWCCCFRVNGTIGILHFVCTAPLNIPENCRR